jgi:raffinose/stachyose/melibiose transport system substrate-binding protein
MNDHRPPRRMARRTFLTLAASTGAASWLAACGGTGGSTTATVKFWDNLLGGDTDTPKSQWFITKAIEQFHKKNKNITVNRSSQSTDIATWHNQFRAASIARNGPDVATMFAGGDVQTFAPYLLPLDDQFSKAERASLIGWESVHKDFKPNGAILAAPFGAGSYFEVMYNKKLLAKAGVRISTPPKDWDEFIALCQRIKQGGVLPIVMGEQEGYTGAWIMATLVGGQIGTDGFFQMRGGKRPLTDPAMLRGYEGYRKLSELKLVNGDAPSVKNEEGQQRFIQGKGALFIQGGWFNKQAVDGLHDNVGNMPIPTYAGAQHAGGIAGGPNEVLAVTKYAKHREEAIKFIKFLLQPEILDEYVRISQTESSNNKKSSISAIGNPLLKNQAMWLEQHPTIYPFDNIMPQQVNDQFYRMNASVFAGRTSPEAAVKTLQNTFNQLS